MCVKDGVTLSEVPVAAIAVFLASGLVAGALIQLERARSECFASGLRHLFQHHCDPQSCCAWWCNGWNAVMLLLHECEIAVRNVGIES